jgi:hypothetical protein
MAAKENIEAGTGFLKAIPTKQRVWIVLVAMAVALFAFIAYEYKDAISAKQQSASNYSEQTLDMLANMNAEVSNMRDDMATKADIARIELKISEIEQASINLEQSILFIGLHTKSIPVEYRQELATRYFKIKGNHINKRYIKGLFDPKCEWVINENGIGYFDCEN